MKTFTKVLLSSLAFASAGALAVQGNDLSTITNATDDGARVGWAVEADGGFVLKGDNNMESTLTIENTRDAGGKKAPVLKVRGRNEARPMNEARPLLSIESIENQAGIEFTTGKEKRGVKLGWTMMYDGKDKSEFFLREIRGAGNWIVTSFYRLETKMLRDSANNEFAAKVFVPFCPNEQDRGYSTINERQKERFPTCPSE